MSDTDELRIREILKIAESHKGRAIRKAVPGVTEHDVSRWKAAKQEGALGEVRLSTAKRSSIDAYLRARDGGAENLSVEEPKQEYAPDPGDWTVEGELRRISALDENETVKMMARDSVAGVLRVAWALAHERAAAKVAEAIIQTDDSSRTRELIAEAQRTGRIPPELFRTIPRPAHLDEIPEEPSFAELQNRDGKD